MSISNRKHERINVDLEVSLRAESGSDEFKGRLHNLSKGGVNVVSDIPCHFGSRLEIKFQLPGGGAVIEALGEAMWVMPMPFEGKMAQNIGMGLKRIDDSAREALANFIDAKTSGAKTAG